MANVSSSSGWAKSLPLSSAPTTALVGMISMVIAALPFGQSVSYHHEEATNLPIVCAGCHTHRKRHMTLYRRHGQGVILKNGGTRQRLGGPCQHTHDVAL